MTVELVCLGNLVVDDVVLADGSTRLAQAGGAPFYTALGAALWGTQVAVVAPLGDDYPRAALEALAERGVDLSGLRRLGRTGLRTWLLYEGGVRHIVPWLSSVTHRQGSPRPSDLAGCFPDARAYHVAPAPLACQEALLVALAARADRNEIVVAIDPHEPVRAASLRKWRAALMRADVFLANEDEIDLDELALGEDPAPARAAGVVTATPGRAGVVAAAPIRAALGKLTGGRLRHVLLKRGARGGILCDLAAGSVQPWAARGGQVVDPTGAGDALAGGFLAGLLAGETPAAALIRGLVSASFALEGWGAAGLLAATPASAQARLEAWRRAAAPATIDPVG